MTKATWTRIAAPDLTRSSQSVSVVGPHVYIFGGEIQPREPVDNAVHVVDIATGAYNKIDADSAPTPRVGHTAAVIGNTIYVFSGRGGPEMTPIDEGGAVHAFDTSTKTWQTLTPADPSAPYPAARSYHCSTATPTAVIVHAGCGDAATGRLNDVWSFSPATRAWTKLPDAPGAPRGGATIAHAAGKLYRFGGFNGTTEVGGAIDVLALDAGEWSSLVFGEQEGLSREAVGDLTKGAAAGPGHRSVSGLHSVGDDKLVLLFGEGKPSITGGHDAAGNFWDDVWAYSPATDTWSEVEAGQGPAARGWFASDVCQGGVVLQGGLDASNARLSDTWVLRLS